MFPRHDIEDGAYGGTCKKTFNITIPTQGCLEEKYHFSVEDMLDTKRILFVTYEYDPATACAPIQLLSEQVANPDRQASRMLYVQDAAHCEDSYSSNVAKAGNGTVRPTVLKAQNEELQTIKEWLSNA